MGEDIKAVNRQLYENSPLRELMVDEEVVPDPLFNAKLPNLAILHEKPEHRLLIMMKARGWSNREIARESGYTDAWISQLFRQPWVRNLLTKFINEAGKDELHTILEGAAVDSVCKLIELRDDSRVPASVRRAASDSLLDRFLGKPTQRVENFQGGGLVPEDMSTIDQRLRELESEEKRLTCKN